MKRNSRAGGSYRGKSPTGKAGATEGSWRRSAGSKREMVDEPSNETGRASLADARRPEPMAPPTPDTSVRVQKSPEGAGTSTGSSAASRSKGLARPSPKKGSQIAAKPPPKVLVL